MAKQRTPDELAIIIKDAARSARHNASRAASVLCGTTTHKRLLETERRQIERLEKAVDELCALAAKSYAAKISKETPDT